VRDKGQAGLILEEGRMGASMRGGVENCPPASVAQGGALGVAPYPVLEACIKQCYCCNRILSFSS
jgi:hypothetical protein